MQKPAALDGAAPRAIDDGLFAGEQLTSREARLVIDETQRHDRRVVEILARGALHVRDGGALSELAGDLGDSVPASECVVLGGQPVRAR